MEGGGRQHPRPRKVSSGLKILKEKILKSPRVSMQQGSICSGVKSPRSTAHMLERALFRQSQEGVGGWLLLSVIKADNRRHDPQMAKPQRLDLGMKLLSGS